MTFSIMLIYNNNNFLFLNLDVLLSRKKNHHHHSHNELHCFSSWSFFVILPPPLYYYYDHSKKVEVKKKSRKLKSLLKSKVVSTKKKKRNSLKIVCSVDKAPIGIRKRIIESTGIVNILEWVTANCTIWKWHSFSFNSSYFDSSFFSSGWYSIINNSFHSSLFFFLYSFILTLLMMVSFRIGQPFFFSGTHTRTVPASVFYFLPYPNYPSKKKFYKM